MVVQAVIGALVGLALIGWGVRVLVGGEAPVLKARGRAWRSVSEAAVFWFLLGAAVLVGPFIWVAGTARWLGPDAGFWLIFVPWPLAILAVAWFRPRKAADLRGQSE
ncbi:hypothetical protein [Paractinoplanes durhamensis]|uniref:DUF4175 domain-containing protein n=1 Tax=Paractinoplanes durhamensis TaxID=113563 RepID=A0ABQ3ZCT8_9ACTN|nr:hypothetical protein [Actinoplanes durhamensis]GIE07673.1 hypothetical protein Adu01nite_90230 [Actinoplanes durhamensis]